MKRHLALLLAALAGAPALGQTAQPAITPSTAPASQPRLTREQAIARLTELQREAAAAFEQKDYPAAEARCRAFLAIAPNTANMHYNLACALARQDKTDAAFAALEKAGALGHAEPDHAAKDDDLASLRNDKRWLPILETFKTNHKAGGGVYEKGADMPGIKTVEEIPDGGLRYRLRMSSDATPEKPNRLVIWMHPSGGSMNRVVEAMAPDLLKHNFALLVLSQKQYLGWTPEEADKLLNKTVPAVAKVPGIDARKPLLMGFSAGGQMALDLWYAKPDAIGGLILDAAYPVAVKNRQYVLRDLPGNKDAIKQTPVFVIVGQRDGGAALWGKAQPEWLAAGVPLTLKTVPNEGHAWLFGKEQTAELTAWLAQIAAGKLPADPAPASQPSSTPATTPATRREVDL